MARLRKSLLAASTPERHAILEAERLARRIAVEVECAERCSADPAGIADCTDVAVRVSRVRWFRSKGDVCVRTVVIMGGTGRMVSFNWRVPVPYRPPRSSRIEVNWGLSPARL